MLKNTMTEILRIMKILNLKFFAKVCNRFICQTCQQYAFRFLVKIIQMIVNFFADRTVRVWLIDFPSQ